MNRITIKDNMQLWFSKEQTVDTPRFTVDKTADGRIVYVHKDEDGVVQYINILKEEDDGLD